LTADSWESVTFDNCDALPAEFGDIQQLQQHLTRLKFQDSSRLKALPDSIGQLQRLELLDMVLCRHLRALPDSIGQLAALKELYLSRCSDLKQVLRFKGPAREPRAAVIIDAANDG
jgi:hypothetical protein